jgi:hypothetical protein
MERTLNYISCVCNGLEYFPHVIIHNVVLTLFITAINCAESLRAILVILVFNNF